MRISNSKLYIKCIDEAIQGVKGVDRLSSRCVLVTGAGGMLGSCIVDSLLRLNDLEGAGIQVYAAGRDVERLKERFGKRRDLDFIHHDLSEPFSSEVHPHYVIHAAGNSDPASFNLDPAGTMMGNVAGTYDLLRFAKMQSCIRFLYVSSGEVYGQGSPDIDSYDESYSGYVDPVSVRSCYPMSKRAAENLCISYGSEYDLDTVIVRPCHIYGPTFKGSDSHAYVQFLMDGLKGRDIVLKSAGTQTRSYIYVTECVAGVLTALLSGEKGQPYNIANPDSVISISELAHSVAEAAGVKVIYNEPSVKDIRDRSPIARQVLNPEKLIRIGFRPCYTAEQGIENTYRILKEIYS